MEVKVGVKNLKIYAFVGVCAEERDVSQEILIDIEVALSGEIRSDEIGSTVNYEEIVEICMQTSLEKKYFLIETLAAEIVNRCLEKLPISQAEIYLCKPGAFKEALGAYVKISKKKT